MRWAKHIERRDYFFPWVNSLWRIDDHHKLIDWKIVIHAGIDGKSRLILFIRASNNNRADTVFEASRERVQKHGLPNRVRGDYGGENLRISSALRPFKEQRNAHGMHTVQGESPERQRFRGRLEARAAWVDLDGADWVGAKEEDPLLAHQARFSFANYGIDWSGVATSRVPSSDDHHIVVIEPTPHINTQIR
ncbi:MAG: hypothetical protein TREMPRED_004212 [Tremellales sp. Tagirdzhanova-0007]|nr:MAG: hypothetical protein TREMPRED_004212 [Tremellales sp. Tagirdzhanova-0007]